MPLGRIEFISANQPIGERGAIVVFHRDPRTKKHPTLLLRRGVNDLQRFQPLGQKPHPAINLAQPLFAVDVLSIFRTVPQCGRFGDGLRYPGPLFLPQEAQFAFQRIVTVTGDVIAAGHGVGVILNFCRRIQTPR